MPQAIKRTFLDTNVLVAAFHHDRLLHERAVELLGDESRDFLASSLVELDLTQPQYNPRHKEEADFYLDYLRNVVGERIEVNEKLIAIALDIVRQSGSAAMDALHLACAFSLGADILITAERKSSPMYRELRVPVLYLGDF